MRSLLVATFVFVFLVSCVHAVEPVTPNASPEARAVLDYLYEMQGKKTLAGQIWVPWGEDGFEYLKKVAGKLPAIQGHDYLDPRTNQRENEVAIAWWRSGGIPTFMWHWGAPTKGPGYPQSKMAINIGRCFEEGTPEHKAMWEDLKRTADLLTELRDAGVPVLWRPMHEFDGGWFWYGMGTNEQFIQLWRTMFDYFAKERGLNNLIWVLCHSGRPRAGWDPGKEYYDLVGVDTYTNEMQPWLYKWVKTTYGDSKPIPLHECGKIPDPDESFAGGTPWSWWMVWHGGYLFDHDREALTKAYNHELVITLDELPSFVKDGDRAVKDGDDARK